MGAGGTLEKKKETRAIYREDEKGAQAESHYPLRSENPARIAVIFFYFSHAKYHTVMYIYPCRAYSICREKGHQA